MHPPVRQPGPLLSPRPGDRERVICTSFSLPTYALSLINVHVRVDDADFKAE